MFKFYFVMFFVLIAALTVLFIKQHNMQKILNRINTDFEERPIYGQKIIYYGDTEERVFQNGYKYQLFNDDPFVLRKGCSITFKWDGYKYVEIDRHTLMHRKKSFKERTDVHKNILI